MPNVAVIIPTTGAVQLRPCRYDGGGSVINWAGANRGTPRGTRRPPNSNARIADLLQIYRRRRVPTREPQVPQRQLIKTVELDLPGQWF